MEDSFSRDAQDEQSRKDETQQLVKPEMPLEHFDPTENLTEDEIKECYEKVEQALEIGNDKDLNLEKSDLGVSDQEWCLVSFIGKECSQKTNELGMKIWGCFGDIQSAKKHADKLNKIEENKIFDIFILEMYTWARIPPDPECIEDQNYHEEKLHDLITDHKRQQMRSKEVFDLRKEKLMKNEDVNQFKRNKEELAKVMEEDTLQNEEAHKKVFGEPKKLPKLEVVPTDEQSGVPLEDIQGSDSAERSTDDSNPYNQKFYSKE